MHNLDEIVRIYFSCVPPQEVLNGTIKYGDFRLNGFERLSKAYILHYSDTENRNLYEYMKQSGKIEGHSYAGLENRSALNVFAALEELAMQLFVMEENEVLCRYCDLLRLRYVTNYVDEDLMVCAYLAARRGRYYEAEQNTGFGWSTIINHNNVQLRGILAEGISENHFHLYGSAPAFHLTWLDYMNHLPDKKGMDELRKIGNRPRISRNHYYAEYREEGYVREILKAALIRVFLIKYLMNDNSLCGGESAPVRKVGKLDVEQIPGLLKNEEPIENYYMEIKNAIDSFKASLAITHGSEALDYCLYLVESGLDEDATGNLYFAGERWFIYQMLEWEIKGREINEELFQWFYAYLIIKNNLRNEIVQTNNTVGFENFSIYTKRKKLYYDSEKLAVTAVYSSLLAANMRSLEIRVTPGASAKKCAEEIRNYESKFGLDAEDGKIKTGTNIYYVFHFTKCKDEFDDELEKARGRSGLEKIGTVFQAEHTCRHYKKRQALNGQANELRKFRELYPKQAEKVLGIDACSQEIGCRPEVFAPAFRFLADHVVSNTGDSIVRQLKLTYHVGEDFLDVIDGLRAIDEAVHFLNLQCGDRIGHGTVLGIDVSEWYACKHQMIVLSQQDYLDNVAWMYHKLTEFHIRDCEGLQHYLSEQYDIYFSKIYLPYLLPDKNSSSLDTGSMSPQLQPEDNRNRMYSGSIHAYYEAWKLRGDEPELYITGEFDRSMKYAGRNYLVNYSYPKTFESRDRLEVVRLYQMYHYNYHVKDEGMKTIEVHIPPMYIEGACKIQKAMQRYIATCGIGIETNPSSNLLISTMRSYDEHPIVRLYNKDLTYDHDKLQECAQINVSINTDDKGVFRTSLENEYALMACALEKVKDECGKTVYNRQMIYQWLDNIRKMGNLQSFYKTIRERE